MLEEDINAICDAYENNVIVDGLCLCYVHFGFPITSPPYISSL